MMLKVNTKTYGFNKTSAYFLTDAVHSPINGQQQCFPNVFHWDTPLALQAKMRSPSTQKFRL